jgi:exonuclease SbcC
VAFTFDYENSRYRVQRSMPRGKGKLLEFQIRDGDTWRVLTEKSLRETQARIESILRMDYETFVNASFFLQGKADQFTQQRPGDRKRILSSILGLEAWDTYKDRATERRRAIEKEISTLDGRLSEVTAELSEEPARRERLHTLEARLAELTAVRKSQEAALETIKQMTATLAEQRKLTEALRAQSERASANLAALQSRLAARETERDAQADWLKRSAAVEADHQAWLQARATLEQWEGVAAQFRAQEKRRQPFVDAINPSAPAWSRSGKICVRRKK